MNKVSPSARRKARRFAMQGLYQWQMTGTSVADIDLQFRSENDMKKVDMDFFHELLRQITLDVDAIEEPMVPYLDRTLDELDPVTRAILRVSAYEMAKRIDIPYRVVINEGVELAKIFGSEDSHRFVNGVLDKLSKSLRAIEIAGPQRKAD